MRIITFSTFILLVMYLFSPTKGTFANEWGLEEQPVELDKCDSVILHYDGKTWNHVYYGFDTRLTDIYGFSDSDIFAIGVPGVILHYDGKSWTHKESHITYRLNSIWGSSNKNIYTVGDYGTILYYNGKNWTKQKSGTNYLLLGIWSNRKDNVYVVGYNPERNY